jgi:hypothetical protein
MKIYQIKIDEEAVAKGVEETARIARAKPEDFIAWIVARAVAPQSNLAQKLYPEPHQ